MCRGDADLPGRGIDVKNARVLLPTNVKPLHYGLTLEPDLKGSHMRAPMSSSTFNQASEVISADILLQFMVNASIANRVG